MAAVRYVELNPTRAGMVKCAWEYPWSSAGFHSGTFESDPLVKDRSLSGLITDWKDFLTGGMTRDSEWLRRLDDRQEMMSSYPKLKI